MFNKPIHVGCPNIGNKKLFFQYMEDIFNRKWLTNDGYYLKKLETEISNFIGVKHSIAVCNATVGLEIVIRSLNLKGEVILPSFTFIATAHALSWFNIKPVFCDISKNSYNINPSLVEELITNKTSAIMGVHVYGRPCDIDGLNEVSIKYNLPLVFDAAHAFGCKFKNQMIGSFGKCEVFSFHATKYFNSFEGGVITTNDDELANKLRLARNFGFIGMDSVDSVGINGKMSEPSAAMGLVNLKSLPDFLKINKNNYYSYKKYIDQIDGIDIIDYPDDSNWQYIVVIVNDKFYLSRDELLEKLRKNNVLARRYFWPGCHKIGSYNSMKKSYFKNLDVTEDIGSRIIVLPNGQSINKDIIKRISKIISK